MKTARALHVEIQTINYLFSYYDKLIIKSLNIICYKLFVTNKLIS